MKTSSSEYNTKCIVHECNNRMWEGEFVGQLCKPCYLMLTTGELVPSTSFVARLLRERDEALKKLEQERDKSATYRVISIGNELEANYYKIQVDRRKVEELQVALDFANEAVDQRERSRKETETELAMSKLQGIIGIANGKRRVKTPELNTNTAIDDMRAKEREVNVPLEKSEGLHEDIIFWLTRAANWRCISASLLVYAEYLLKCIPDRSEIDWTVLEQARAMFKEEGK